MLRVSPNLLHERPLSLHGRRREIEGWAEPGAESGVTTLSRGILIGSLLLAVELLPNDLPLVMFVF